ncbi:glycine zipper 2TM domain-containing protein [Candidatus Odyssella thessalonicensis]|uniref:glycine zipper 2TM domain-containing protein n=1 Tax=Candidatus Odyssella thessalonicensis TaxID=84647 RepID=UPI000225B473|nr:glycine zipper 2TM domain-containing protein [Candidatus Odyssella thessalonicensis]
MKKILMLSVALLAAVNMTGCAPRIGGSDYSVAGSGEVSDTLRGVIVGKRVVRINMKDPEHQNDPGVGAGIGGVTGVVAGSQFGKGSGQLAGAAVGALAGAVAGHFAEQSLTEQEGFEYQIDLDNGRLMTIAQGKDPELMVGQRVLVIMPLQQGNRTTVSFGGRINASRARVIADRTR